MQVYFIERGDGLVFNSVQVGGRPPKDDQLRRKEVAVATLGGSTDDWEGRAVEFNPELGQVIRLIEPDGQGGYSVHQAPLLAIDGLMAALSRGWFPDCQVMTADDGHTFAAPAADVGLALDVVQDDATGEVQLQPYEWDPETETKADPPAGFTVLMSDLLRGVLPDGAVSLDELQEEGV